MNFVKYKTKYPEPYDKHGRLVSVHQKLAFSF